MGKELAFFSLIFAYETQIFADMDENEIFFIIRGVAFKVHNSLGPGLVESVYERGLVNKEAMIRIVNNV